MKTRRALLTACALSPFAMSNLREAQAANPTNHSTSPKVLRGSGASMPAALYRTWADHQKESFLLQYYPIGSGGALKALAQGKADFGSTEILLSSDILVKNNLIQFPVASGLVVAATNLPSVEQGAVRLSAEVLGGIYLGKIRWWRDPAILSLNPGLDLPALSITPFSRVGSSGTSLAWSRYLDSQSDLWRKQIGVADRPIWDYGLYTGDNHRIAALVLQTPGAIGYMQASYASQVGLNIAQLQNDARTFVRYDTQASALEHWPLSIDIYALLPLAVSARAKSREVTAFFRAALIDGSETALRQNFLPLNHARLAEVYQLWKEADIES